MTDFPMENLLPCPGCGGRPVREYRERDRGQHPSMTELRYVCSRGNHVVSSAWVDDGLRGTQTSSELIALGKEAWNSLIGDWSKPLTSRAAPPESKPATAPEVLRFTYVNWKGETGDRTVLPLRIYYGHTAWHPESQWLMEAWDLDKQAVRAFALRDCVFRGETVSRKTMLSAVYGLAGLSPPASTGEAVYLEAWYDAMTYAETELLAVLGAEK